MWVGGGLFSGNHTGGIHVFLWKSFHIQQDNIAAVYICTTYLFTLPIKVISIQQTALVNGKYSSIGIIANFVSDIYILLNIALLPVFSNRPQSSPPQCNSIYIYMYMPI